MVQALKNGGLRVGVVGVGIMGSNHARVLAGLSGIQLIGVADPDPAQRELVTRVLGCPAVYDLGEAVNVVALSVTEGEDKPLKYPFMFRKADLVLLTKIDLLPYLEVDVAAIEDALARTMPRPAVLPVSAKTGQGLDRWLVWLTGRRPVMRHEAAG